MSTFPDSFSDTPGLTRLMSNEPGKVLKSSPAPRVASVGLQAA